LKWVVTEVPTPGQLRRALSKWLKPTSIPSNPEKCAVTPSLPITGPAPRFITVEFKSTDKAVKQVNPSYIHKVPYVTVGKVENAFRLKNGTQSVEVYSKKQMETALVAELLCSYPIQVERP
jgi:hypothetical protein